MAKIVWLASYPRSGNTWLRFMLSCLLRDGPVANSAEVSHLVPDIHDGIRGNALFGNHTTIVKTHWAFNSAPPLREDVVGVIHLVRNPLDVLESNQNYAMTRSGNFFAETTEEERCAKARAFVGSYIRNGGHTRFMDFGLGSWEDHTSSWVSPYNAIPKLLVRYEDLPTAPSRQLCRFAKFLRLEKTDNDIAAAAEAASFDAMRRTEDREIEQCVEGIFYQARNASAYSARQRFIRRDDSRLRLTPEQRDQALRRFGKL